MARRTVLTARQREALFALPSEEADLLRHCILSDDDLTHVRRRRRPANRLGFALQRCALRHPGRLIQPGELIPPAMLEFVAAQVGTAGDELAAYGVREPTRYQHSAALQRIYGYRSFEGLAREELTGWAINRAEECSTNEALATAAMEEMRRRRIIVPAPTTVERLCADALVAAERRIAHRIADRLDADVRARLGRMLAERIDDGPSRIVSRFVWLRRNEPGGNSADANRLLDRLEWLSELAIPPDVIADIAPRRIARLRRQGERYYADGLREVPEVRQLAILAVCAIEWRAALADAIVETHERITGRLYRQAQRTCTALVEERKGAIAGVLRSVAMLGNAMVQAQAVGGDVTVAVARSVGWDGLERLTATASSLTVTIDADPIDQLGSGYHRFRRYAPRMLDVLELRGAHAGEPLLDAVRMLQDLNRRGRTAVATDAPTMFASSKWRQRFAPSGTVTSSPSIIDRRMWETAVLFRLRDALRSGDMWLAHSHK